jgi:hypothetical protein
MLVCGFCPISALQSGEHELSNSAACAATAYFLQSLNQAIALGATPAALFLLV